MYSVQFALSCGVTDSSIATGILGMKAVLTSDLLPLLYGHFNIYLCMCRLLRKHTQYVLTINNNDFFCFFVDLWLVGKQNTLVE
jgi:hypothetical protein